MGTLIHGPLQVEMDDRVLIHLETVIVNKFRRGESFLLTWWDRGSPEGGRRALWLAPRHPVYFSYVDDRVAGLDDDWIRRLLSAANTPRGLVLTDENGRPADVHSRV